MAECVFLCAWTSVRVDAEQDGHQEKGMDVWKILQGEMDQ
jgi:hypothetical protein